MIISERWITAIFLIDLISLLNGSSLPAVFLMDPVCHQYSQWIQSANSLLDGFNQSSWWIQSASSLLDGCSLPAVFLMDPASIFLILLLFGQLLKILLTFPSILIPFIHQFEQKTARSRRIIRRHYKIRVSSALYILYMLYMIVMNIEHV